MYLFGYTITAQAEFNARALAGLGTSGFVTGVHPSSRLLKKTGQLPRNRGAPIRATATETRIALLNGELAISRVLFGLRPAQMPVP